MTKALFALLILAGTACTHVTIARTEKSIRSGTQDALTLHSYAWGFVPNDLPAESEVCPKSRLDSVDVYQDSGDVWLTVVTLGIYVPYQADIYCSTALNGSH